MKTIRTLLENDNTNTIDWEYYSSTFKISKDDIDKLYKSVVITCMDPKMWKVSPRVYEDILFNGREDLRYSSPSDSDEDIEYHELATQARHILPNLEEFEKKKITFKQTSDPSLKDVVKAVMQKSPILKRIEKSVSDQGLERAGVLMLRNEILQRIGGVEVRTRRLRYYKSPFDKMYPKNIFRLLSGRLTEQLPELIKRSPVHIKKMAEEIQKSYALQIEEHKNHIDFYTKLLKTKEDRIKELKSYLK